MLLPPSAARKMRIFCSVACLLFFMVWLLLGPQTNITSGPDSGGSPHLDLPPSGTTSQLRHSLLARLRHRSISSRDWIAHRHLLDQPPCDTTSGLQQYPSARLRRWSNSSRGCIAHRHFPVPPPSDTTSRLRPHPSARRCRLSLHPAEIELRGGITLLRFFSASPPDPPRRPRSLADRRREGMSACGGTSLNCYARG